MVGGVYLLAAFSTAASALLGRPLRPDLTGVTTLVTNQTELKYSKTWLQRTCLHWMHTYIEVSFTSSGHDILNILAFTNYI